MKLTKEQYNERIKDFDIYMIGDYKNMTTNVMFKCKNCGDERERNPNTVLYRGSNKLKCGNCNDLIAIRSKIASENNKSRLTTETYNEKIKDLDIYLISDYKNMNSKGIFKCKKCGDESERNLNIVHSKRHSPNKCKKCNDIVSLRNKSKRTIAGKRYVEYLATRGFELIDPDQYDGQYTKLDHKCLSCGNVWNTCAEVIKGQGSGCPSCAHKESKGEKSIKQFLSEHLINSIQEKTFDELTSDSETSLRFDFFLPELNTCIEYDGEQHFRPIDFFGGEVNFRRIQYHDALKNQYCKDNNIKLIRIKYNEDVIFKLTNELEL